MVKKILVFQVGVTSKSVHACVFFFFFDFLFISFFGNDIHCTVIYGGCLVLHLCLHVSRGK